MKINFKTLLTSVVSLFCTQLSAQNSLDSFSFLGNAYDVLAGGNAVKIETENIVGSNAFNTQMFSDVLFRSSFTPSAKEKFISGSQKKTNLYSQSVTNLDHKLNSKWGIYSKLKSVVGFSSNKDFSSMLFFGNSAFENESVRSKKMRYVESTSATVGASLVKRNDEKFYSRLSLGASFVMNYRSIDVKELSVFTAPNGEYLDVSFEDVAYTEKTNSLDGIGIEFNQHYRYCPNKKNTFGLELLDFNMTRFFDKTSVKLDSSFRFNGFSYNFLGDSNSLSAIIDSTFERTIENGRQDKKWGVLPIRIHFSWTHELSNKTGLVVKIKAMDVGNYGVLGTIGIGHEFSNNFKGYTDLGYGNFNGIIWNVAGELRIAKKYSAYLGLRSLHALAIPENTTNYGFSFGFSKIL